MTEKLYRLTPNNFLSPAAVAALLEKERLIRGEVQTEEPEGVKVGLISTYYVSFSWSISDSAAYASWIESNFRTRQLSFQFESDPFGDEAKLKAIYAEFEQEELALANEGLAEFRQVMEEYDGD